MNATNIQRIGQTRILISTTAHGDEYAVRLPLERVAMPVFEMLSEPSCDRRHFRQEVG